MAGWESSARVSVVGREGCHLCDVALEIVRRVAAETGADVEVVNIDEHPDLLARYADEIPVTFVDGAQHDYWRVDEGRLRAALS